MPRPRASQGRGLLSPATSGPTALGYSPDRMQDIEAQSGSVDRMMEDVLAARYRTTGAPAHLSAMSPGDRAAADRYANFAIMARDAPAHRIPIDYLGGMGAMVGTEAMKAARPVQRLVSRAYGAITGGGGDLFGGQDTSPASLSNITSAHYGFLRGMGLR